MPGVADLKTSSARWTGKRPGDRLTPGPLLTAKIRSTSWRYFVAQQPEPEPLSVTAAAVRFSPHVSPQQSLQVAPQQSLQLSPQQSAQLSPQQSSHASPQQAAHAPPLQHAVEVEAMPANSPAVANTSSATAANEAI